jgi:hypothetical protein
LQALTELLGMASDADAVDVILLIHWVAGTKYGKAR